MSELERKPRDSEVESKKAQKQQTDEAEHDEKKDGESDAPSTVMPWDADVDHLMARLELFVRDLTGSMGMTEFRSLVHSYRELSPMGRRAVANKLQQRRLLALLRALHAGDYRLYQDTWMTDVEVRDEAKAARDLAARGGKMGDGE